MVMKSKLQCFFLFLFIFQLIQYSIPFMTNDKTFVFCQKRWDSTGLEYFGCQEFVFFCTSRKKKTISMLIYFASFCTNNWDFYFWYFQKKKFLWEIKFSENFIEIPKLIVFCFFIFFLPIFCPLFWIFFY